jgi:hypothetical protein
MRILAISHYNKRRDDYDNFCIATDSISPALFYVKTADAPIPLSHDPYQSLPGRPGPRLSQIDDTMFVVCLSCAFPYSQKTAIRAYNDKVSLSYFPYMHKHKAINMPSVSLKKFVIILIYYKDAQKKGVQKKSYTRNQIGKNCTVLEGRKGLTVSGILPVFYFAARMKPTVLISGKKFSLIS